MNATIKIGLQDVEMAANAASPYFYKRVFSEDFLKKTMEKEPDTYIFVKMGFIMAMSAKRGLEDMCRLKEMDFVEWVAQFSPMDITNAIPAMANLYTAQENGSSVPKKEDG